MLYLQVCGLLWWFSQSVQMKHDETSILSMHVLCDSEFAGPHGVLCLSISGSKPTAAPLPVAEMTLGGWAPVFHSGHTRPFRDCFILSYGFHLELNIYEKRKGLIREHTFASMYTISIIFHVHQFSCQIVGNSARSWRGWPWWRRFRWILWRPSCVIVCETLSNIHDMMVQSLTISFQMCNASQMWERQNFAKTVSHCTNADCNIFVYCCMFVHSTGGQIESSAVGLPKPWAQLRGLVRPATTRRGFATSKPASKTPTKNKTGPAMPSRFCHVLPWKSSMFHWGEKLREAQRKFYEVLPEGMRIGVGWFLIFLMFLVYLGVVRSIFSRKF